MKNFTITQMPRVNDLGDEDDDQEDEGKEDRYVLLSNMMPKVKSKTSRAPSCLERSQ